MDAGADFIKTSTGKVQPAATLPVTPRDARGDPRPLRRDRQADRHEAGRRISTAKTAIQYLVMLRETLGQDWLTPDLFRIGASSLANDILMQIVKQRTGVYQAAEYFALE